MAVLFICLIQFQSICKICLIHWHFVLFYFIHFNYKLQNILIFLSCSFFLLWLRWDSLSILFLFFFSFGYTLFLSLTFLLSSKKCKVHRNGLHFVRLSLINVASFNSWNPKLGDVQNLTNFKRNSNSQTGDTIILIKIYWN